MKCDWSDALEIASSAIRDAGEDVAVVAGPFADVETLCMLKDLANKAGSEQVTVEEKFFTNADIRSDYVFNSTIAGIEEADSVLIIGCNPRWILRKSLKFKTFLGLISIDNFHSTLIVSSENSYLFILDMKLHWSTLEFEKLGFMLRLKLMSLDQKLTSLTPTTTTETILKVRFSENNLIFYSNLVINDIASGKHDLAAHLKNCERPMVIVGSSVFDRADGAAVLSSVKEMCASLNVAEGWNPLNVMHRNASTVGALDLGYKTGTSCLNKPKVIINYGADEGSFGADDVSFCIFEDNIKFSKCFSMIIFQLAPGGTMIYIGHQGDKGASAADVILPGAAYTEKNGTYVNTEGRVQLTRTAVTPPGAAREDWKIIRVLSELTDLKVKRNS